MLLRTLPKNINVHVVYKATDEWFQRGYDKLTKIHNAYFHKEDSFKNDVLKIIAKNNDAYISFFVDDMVWYRRYCENAIEDMLAYMNTAINTLCFSLRLGTNTNYMYQYNREIEVPKYTNCLNNIIQWWYINIPINNNFGYPFSLDGHVFDRQYIFDKLVNLSFYNPNQLEDELIKNHINKPTQFKPFMASFSNSMMFNTPVNRVQHLYPNKTGNKASYTTHHLNEEFLDGRRLFLGENFAPDSIRGCHQEVELRLI
jgi:hypothetical protein